MDDEREVTVKVAKKQRANTSEERISTAKPEPTKRGGRTRQAQRSRPEEEETNDKAKSSVKATPVLSEDDSVVVLLEDDTGKKGKKCVVLITQDLFISIYEFWDP